MSLRRTKSYLDSASTALRSVRRSQFVRNTLTVMTGTVVARLIGFAFAPLISRIFSPLDFGLAGSFAAVAGVLAAGVTLEYTQALMLPKEKSDALGVFVVSCVGILAVTALCALVCLSFPGAVNGLMKTTGAWALVLLVLATFVNGFIQACQAWCVRNKAFRTTSVAQVIRSLASSGTQVGFGALGAGASGLIISSVVADVLAGVTLLRGVLPDLRAHWRSLRWDSLRRHAKEYCDFPKYSASQNVISAVSLGLPVLLLTHFYSLSVAGAYAFSMRMLMMPLGLLETALRQVLFQKVTESHHHGARLSPLYLKLTSGLFAMVMAPAAVMLVWAPEIFTWVFGQQWQMAGEFSRSLALWLMLSFSTLPAILFTRLIRYQRVTFVYHLTTMAARVSTLVIGGLYLTPHATIHAFSFVGASMNVVLILLVGRAVMRTEGDGSLHQLKHVLVR